MKSVIYYCTLFYIPRNFEVLKASGCLNTIVNAAFGGQNYSFYCGTNF